MKRIYQYIICVLAFLIVGACAKEAFWNQNSEVPESEKGTIVGQLMNDEDNIPLKGVKILFERQTGKNGAQTFVDTVSTDAEGNFSYSVPFPNKVRLVVRDTGRYVADTTIVEVLAQQNYPVLMKSHPRFGVSSIEPLLLDDIGQIIEGANLALYVRENNEESYSLVQTILTGADGKSRFEDIAFPVNYKVVLAEDSLRYKSAFAEGKLLTKKALEITLKTEVLFGISNVNFVSNAKNASVKVTFKEPWSEYQKIIDFTTDATGGAVIELPYPSSGEVTSLIYNGIELKGVLSFQLDKASEKEINLEIKDKTAVKVLVSNLSATAGTPYIGGKVNVYMRELGSINEADFTLFNSYVADAQGYINIDDIEWPKELKLVPNYSDMTGRLGALEFSAPSTKIVVKDFNNIDATFDMSYPNGYMLLGNNSSTSTSAQIENADLGIYKEPSLFGNASEVTSDLTFQVKIKLIAKGGNNPSIGGTVSNYSANEGVANEGFGFMHSGHGNPQFTWRFKYGKSMVTSKGVVAVGGDWVTLTAVVKRESGTSRRIFVYTNGIKDEGAGFSLPADRSAVSSVKMLFGNGPSQFGGGSLTNYIKDFRIYTRALSDEEVLGNACNDFVTPDKLASDLSLIGYWPMNDGYTGSFKNYSKDPRAIGKDMIIVAPKEIKNIDRKCD